MGTRGIGKRDPHQGREARDCRWSPPVCTQPVHRPSSWPICAFRASGCVRMSPGGPPGSSLVLDGREKPSSGLGT